MTSTLIETLMTNNMFGIIASLFSILMGIIVLITRSSLDKKIVDSQTSTKNTFFTRLTKEHVKHVGEKGVRRESLAIGIFFIVVGFLSLFF